MKHLAGILGGAFIGALCGRYAAIKGYSFLASIVMDDYVTTGALLGAVIGLALSSIPTTVQK